MHVSRRDKSRSPKRKTAVAVAPRATAAKRPPARRDGAPRTLARRPLAERAAAIMAGLDTLYADAHCELDFATPFQLLVATILSAQCTDKLVNTVTPALFAKYPDAAAMARADVADVERMVSRTGFFRQKAKNIVGSAQAIVERHGGEVPRSMDALTAMPGVARKTANVILGSAYGMNEGIAVDTHVTRLSGRLALSKHDDPKKIEQDLLKIFPRDHWTRVGHQLIWHGRRVCFARKPDCEHCLLAPHCPSAGKV
jgi:endonuclease-3